MRTIGVLYVSSLVLLVAACQGGLSEAEVERLVDERVEEMTAGLVAQLQSEDHIFLGSNSDSVTTIRGSVVVDGIVAANDFIAESSISAKDRLIIGGDTSGGVLTLEATESRALLTIGDKARPDIVRLETASGGGGLVLHEGLVALTNESGDFTVFIHSDGLMSFSRGLGQVFFSGQDGEPIAAIGLSPTGDDLFRISGPVAILDDPTRNAIWFEPGLGTVSLTNEEGHIVVLLGEDSEGEGMLLLTNGRGVGRENLKFFAP